MGERFSAPVQTGPGAHPVSCTMGTGSFPGVKSGRGVTLTPHPLRVPWSRKSRAIPLLPSWAVRPVQSLSVLYKGPLYLFKEKSAVRWFILQPYQRRHLSFPVRICNCRLLLITPVISRPVAPGLDSTEKTELNYLDDLFVQFRADATLYH